MPTPDQIAATINALTARGWNRPARYTRAELYDLRLAHRVAVMRVNEIHELEQAYKQPSSEEKS